MRNHQHGQGVYAVDFREREVSGRMGQKRKYCLIITMMALCFVAYCFQISVYAKSGKGTVTMADYDQFLTDIFENN